jgi:hypothetical protein
MTGNPSACAKANWEMCKSAIAQYLSVIKKLVRLEALINPITLSRTQNYSPRVPPYTWQYIIIFPSRLYVFRASGLFPSGLRICTSLAFLIPPCNIRYTFYQVHFYFCLSY